MSQKFRGADCPGKRRESDLPPLLHGTHLTNHHEGSIRHRRRAHGRRANWPLAAWPVLAMSACRARISPTTASTPTARRSIRSRASCCAGSGIAWSKCSANSASCRQGRALAAPLRAVAPRPSGLEAALANVPLRDATAAARRQADGADPVRDRDDAAAVRVVDPERGVRGCWVSASATHQDARPRSGAIS